MNDLRNLFHDQSAGKYGTIATPGYVVRQSYLLPKVL